jgi:hypothetical protein
MNQGKLFDSLLEEPRNTLRPGDLPRHDLRERRGPPRSLYRGTASLINLLEERELIRFTPFGVSFCRNASLEDLDLESISRFLVLARRDAASPCPRTPRRKRCWST